MQQNSCSKILLARCTNPTAHIRATVYNFELHQSDRPMHTLNCDICLMEKKKNLTFHTEKKKILITVRTKTVATICGRLEANKIS